MVHLGAKKHEKLKVSEEMGDMDKIKDSLSKIDRELEERINKMEKLPNDEFAKIEESIRNEIEGEDEVSDLVDDDSVKKSPTGETKVEEDLKMVARGEKKEVEFQQPEIQAPPEISKEELMEGVQVHHGDEHDEQVEWWKFDDSEYLKDGALKPGEDPYAANKFNLAASDKLKSSRNVPDTRHAHCRKENECKLKFRQKSFTM